ncbi:MAG: TetR/AcrR family transcriptional regulator [Terriglobales bacterium]|jgi:AcrR family transcriptional regulator
MPRHPDPGLEERILNAALKLWRKGAEKTLTMRAVAKAADTNTPAVYRRFKDRRDILHALLRRIQKDVADVVRPCQSAEEACERYLDFALSHPHEYELFYEHAYQLPRPAQGPIREHRPTMALMEAKLAERLGGSPGDHTSLALALWAITHGTATILISKSIPAEHADELRSVCSSAVKAMVRNASVFDWHG